MVAPANGIIRSAARCSRFDKTRQKCRVKHLTVDHYYVQSPVDPLIERMELAIPRHVDDATVRSIFGLSNSSVYVDMRTAEEVVHDQQCVHVSTEIESVIAYTIPSEKTVLLICVGYLSVMVAKVRSKNVEPAHMCLTDRIIKCTRTCYAQT